MFLDRIDAGRKLARELEGYRQAEATIVSGIPRGGLVVAAEVARSLRLPLLIAPVRKVGAPSNPELALGAVDAGSDRVLDLILAEELGVAAAALERAAENTRNGLRKWLEGMPEGRRPRTGESVILVDDGIATGYTAEVAVRVMRRRGAPRVVLAVPVAPPDTLARLRGQVDDLVCLETPEPFYAVGSFFQDWPQVTDDQVRALLLSGNRM